MGGCLEDCTDGIGEASVAFGERAAQCIEDLLLGDLMLDEEEQPEKTEVEPERPISDFALTFLDGLLPPLA